MIGSRLRKWFRICSPSSLVCDENPLRDLAARGKHVRSVTDLREPSQAPDSSGSGERLQVAVVNLGGEPSGADLVEARVLVNVEREAVRADRAMEDDHQLVLLLIADSLHLADQSRTLGLQQAADDRASSSSW